MLAGTGYGRCSWTSAGSLAGDLLPACLRAPVRGTWGYCMRVVTWGPPGYDTWHAFLRPDVCPTVHCSVPRYTAPQPLPRCIRATRTQLRDAG